MVAWRVSSHRKKHLHSILAQLGGVEFQNMTSLYRLPFLGLVLCVYVDELMLAGKLSLYDDIWKTLSSRLLRLNSSLMTVEACLRRKSSICFVGQPLGSCLLGDHRLCQVMC